MGCQASKQRQKSSKKQSLRRKTSLEESQEQNFAQKMRRKRTTIINLQEQLPQSSSHIVQSPDEKQSTHYQPHRHDNPRKSSKFRKQDVIQLYSTLKSQQQQKIQQIQTQNKIPSQEEIMNIDFKEKKQVIQDFFQKNRTRRRLQSCNGCSGKITRPSFYSYYFSGYNPGNKTEFQFNSISSLESFTDDENENNSQNDNQKQVNSDESPLKKKPKTPGKKRRNSLPYKSPAVCMDCRSPKVKFRQSKISLNKINNNIHNQIISEKQIEIEISQNNNNNEINNQASDYYPTVATEVDDFDQTKKATLSPEFINFSFKRYLQDHRKFSMKLERKLEILEKKKQAQTVQF